MEENNELIKPTVEYTEDNIRHLDDMEHIRVRSGMYIGRLGDGQQSDDGICVVERSDGQQHRRVQDGSRKENRGNH